MMLEEKIRDLLTRLPAHSVKPSMLLELEGLEERLNELKKMKQRQDFTKIDGGKS